MVEKVNTCAFPRCIRSAQYSVFLCSQHTPAGIPFDIRIKTAGEIEKLKKEVDRLTEVADKSDRDFWLMKTENTRLRKRNEELLKRAEAAELANRND